MHGAHFAVLTNGVDVRFAKRGAVLQPDQPFFGYETVAAGLAASALLGWQHVVATQANVVLVAVHGELCGGRYPHDAVPAVPGARPVQTGVWYSPRVEFLVFDAAVYVQTPDAATPQRTWLPYPALTALVTHAGFTAVPHVFTGPRAAAMARNPRFTTRVPDLWRLPPIADNIAEGVVVRPACGDGSALVKLKNAEFAELEDGFRSTARPALAPLLMRLTPARVAAAASKEGHDTPPAVLGAAVMDDIVADVCCTPEGAALVAQLGAADLDEARAAIAAAVEAWRAESM